jgi:hypothetical protein
MKLPNKIIKYEDSILAKFPIILSKLNNGDKSVLELYREVADRLENITEYVEILCCLYSLNKVELNSVSGGLHYVERTME